MKEKCGYMNMHWYQDGDSCQCGQVPKDIFFAANCTCGGYRLRKPIHDPDCPYIAWAKKRNRWIIEHMGDDPPIDPPMKSVSYRVKDIASTKSS